MAYMRLNLYIVTGENLLKQRGLPIYRARSFQNHVYFPCCEMSHTLGYHKIIQWSRCTGHIVYHNLIFLRTSRTQYRWYCVQNRILLLFLHLDMSCGQLMRLALRNKTDIAIISLPQSDVVRYIHKSLFCLIRRAILFIMWFCQISRKLVNLWELIRIYLSTFVYFLLFVLSYCFRFISYLSI